MEIDAVNGLFIRDKRDFEHLFKTYYSLLCSYANNFLKDTDASEEVVQETMFRIWTNRNNLVITTSVQGYLFRAVRNGCMNVVKHQEIKQKYRDSREKDHGPVYPSEDDTVIISELQKKIREAIDRLPMERRKIFLFSRYDGLTYRQIADELGISVKTVENQMGKALKTLREELAEYLPWLLLFFADLFGKN